MANARVIGSVLKSLVPISRFNKGEANRVFDEVRETGIKVVLKNNSPTCVLLSPEVYEDMLETIEDYRLLLVADERMKAAKVEDFVSVEAVMRELGITKADVEAAKVEIE